MAPNRILPASFRSAAGVLQIEPVDGRCDRLSSTPDGLRRVAAGLNVVARNVARQNAEDRFALGRIGWERLQSLPGGDGSLRVRVELGAQIGRFQIAFSAETRVAGKSEGVRQQAEHLADEQAWREA